MVGNMPLPQWGSGLMTARDNTTFIHYIGYILVMGLLVASAATNVGHELTHRKRNKFDMFVGNWLLALTWDCSFAIEHEIEHVFKIAFRKSRMVNIKSRIIIHDI